MDTGKPKRSPRAKLITAGVCLAPMLALFGASTANAYEIDNFSANILQADGTTFESQAGDHPYQGIITFDTKRTAGPPITGGNNEGQTETIRVDTPEGLVPNPEAVPKCEQEQLEDNACPADTQIGTTELRLSRVLSDGGTPGGPTNPLNLPAGSRGDVRLVVGLFNMEPREGQLARFSFNPTQPGPQATGEIVDIVGGMRPDDNGLFFTINEVARPTAANPSTPTLTGSTLTFWGSPGSTDHLAQRGASSLQIVSLGGGVVAPPGGAPLTLGGTAGGQAATTGNVAFLRSPTSCSGPQQARLTLDSYAGERRTRDYTVGAETNGLQGCDQVPFSSTTSFGPSSMQNDAPVPLSVQLDVPQTTDSDTLATSDVDKVAVTLPPGMTISPSAANGLEACTDDQFNQGNENAISCPTSSRVGAATITTPVLDSPLQGNVYIGQPLSGNRYRLFINADGHGISIRLKGTVTPDPVTGQITAVFDDNPQLPFSQFKIDFDGGSRAIIASAQTCGTAQGGGTLTPWSGNADSTTTDDVETTGCSGNPFEPAFSAASSNPVSGKYAPLGVIFGRRDGNQFLSGISAKLPVGMTAKIKGVTQCTEAQVATIACPASSQVGTVSVSAGPGEEPYSLSGPAYLTGGYKGGAFGTVAVIHVVAGPYDLGYVVVRQALRVDPNTAQVTIDSDPLPQIQEGIVLRLRALRLDVNRKDFLRNPTSCGPASIQTTLTGAAGGVATPAAGQAMTGCDKLVFGPRMSVKFDNRSQMKKGGHPRVVVVARQSESEAGIKSTRVTLPKDVALQPDNAKALCTTAQAATDACPKASIVGSAIATTTILNRPVSGPVYFVQGERRTATGAVVRTLPTLYIPLSGEARINLRAQTSVSKDRLVTTLPAIPDAPITNFALTINGGKNGIIEATNALCGKTIKAEAKLGGWNAKSITRKPTIKTSCRAAAATTR
jgi:hypothetical protein